MQHHTDEQKLPIGKVLGRITSGVYVLSATHDGTSAAMLASWVMQAGFEPPCISIAIATGRPIIEMIRRSSLLAVSIVAEHDKTLMKRFARGFKEGEDPFAGIATSRSPAGVPILSDALGWIEAKLIHTCAYAADHEILIGQVTAGACCGKVTRSAISAETVFIIESQRRSISSDQAAVARRSRQACAGCDRAGFARAVQWNQSGTIIPPRPDTISPGRGTGFGPRCLPADSRRGCFRHGKRTSC